MVSVCVCCIVFMTVDRSHTGCATRWSVCVVLCSWLLTDLIQAVPLDGQCVCYIVFMTVDRSHTGCATRWSVCVCIVLCSWLLTDLIQVVPLDGQCVCYIVFMTVDRTQTGCATRWWVCVLYCVPCCWQNPDRLCQWMTAWHSLTWNPVTRSGPTPVIMRVTSRRARKLSVYELFLF